MVSYTDLEIFDLIKSKYFDKKIKILSPIIKSRKGHYRELFVSIKKQGFDKVRVDNEIIDIVDGFELDRYKIHTIEILIDNFTLRDDNNVESFAVLHNGFSTLKEQEIQQRAQSDLIRAQVDSQRIQSQESIAEMKIAQQREAAEMKEEGNVRKEFYDILKDVRSSDTTTKGE